MPITPRSGVVATATSFERLLGCLQCDEEEELVRGALWLSFGWLVFSVVVVMTVVVLMVLVVSG